MLYDAHVMSTTLASFRLDTASGELTLINKVDTGIDIPAHLITDRAGRFLLTAYYEGGGITVHRLDDDGAIGDLVQRIDTGPRAHAVLLTEDERFVFVPHVCPNNKTSQFRFDASTGQLAPNDPPVLAPPAGDPGPRHICFRPLGDVAYIVNEQANTLTAHRFDSEGGTLSIFQDISTLPADYARRREHRPRRSPPQWPVVLRIQSRPRQHRRLPHRRRGRAQPVWALPSAGQPALVQH